MGKTGAAGVALLIMVVGPLAVGCGNAASPSGFVNAWLAGWEDASGSF